jgi:hypothetical protein
MVVTKIIMVGVAIFALMVVARREGWPQRVGVTGSCVATQAPAGQPAASAWYLCKQGVLTGFPNLETDSCTSVGYIGKRELWSCTAPLVSMPGY